MVAWGDNGYGQANMPAGLGNAVAVAADGSHCLALRADGSVIAWGCNYSGQTNVPVVPSNALVLAAGPAHNMALVGSGPPPTGALAVNPTATSLGLSLQIPSRSGRFYASEYTTSLQGTAWWRLPLVAGNGHLLTLTDLSASGVQRFYRFQEW